MGSFRRIVTHVAIRWETQPADGGLVYLNEHMQGTSGFVQYGPMCSEIVGTFIAERKAYHMRLRDDVVRRVRESNPLAALASMERAY